MSTPSNLTFAQKHSLPFSVAGIALTSFLAGVYRGTNAGEACVLVALCLLAAVVSYHYWWQSMTNP